MATFKFVSLPQPVTASFQVLHGLPSTPAFFQGTLSNVTAQAGFVPGDQVLLADASGVSTGFQVWASPTDVGYAMSTAPPEIVPKLGGTPELLTIVNWQVVLRAVYVS